MRVGGSGTEQGMSQRQRTDFIYLVSTLQPDEFHHGDCIGADEEMHNIVKRLFPGCKVHVHPPLIDSKRAFCYADVYHAPKGYLERDDDIAQAVEILIAAPLQHTEIVRSGTWATVRYARKYKKRVEVLYR